MNTAICSQLQKGDLEHEKVHRDRNGNGSGVQPAGDVAERG
jgi:hypothetical protein